MTGEIEFVLEGECSARVFSWNSDNERSGMTVARSKNGWKLCQRVSTKNVESQYVEGVTILIDRYRDIQDYYLTVFNIKGEKLNIRDNRNSNFICSQDRKSGYYGYYAYVHNYNEQYQLVVDGKVLEWEHSYDE